MQCFIPLNGNCCADGGCRLKAADEAGGNSGFIWIGPVTPVDDAEADDI
jgi:hypothetical protein